MRKRMVAFTLVMVLLLAATAAAAVTPRSVTVVPVLSFNGTTATCKVTAVGNTEDETIFATIKLMHGDEMLKTWYPSAKGILQFEENVEVTRGETYTLTVKVISDTTDLPEVSLSGKCE